MRSHNSSLLLQRTANSTEKHSVLQGLPKHYTVRCTFGSKGHAKVMLDCDWLGVHTKQVSWSPDDDRSRHMVPGLLSPGHSAGSKQQKQQRLPEDPPAVL
ncbi:hypothetical protein CgunFtcFv8_006844 [Champsocephalus gunnari]|uniref:Uncharacterized protein n=1 Tax=Champsocephalus gunnari TaxID=52237 RepID=A0AAN8CIG7_CHAGU|nr:hypothetical protein CgunFtcFv8_006844 [Champsocephalus gunnari]